MRAEQDRAGWRRLLHRAVRIPLSLLAWTITGSTTHAIPDLAAEIAACGLALGEEQRSRLGSFSVVAAERVP